MKENREQAEIPSVTHAGVVRPREGDRLAIFTSTSVKFQSFVNDERFRIFFDWLDGYNNNNNNNWSRGREVIDL